MMAPVEPAMARPQGGTSFLERAAIVVLFVFSFFSTGWFYKATRAEGCGGSFGTAAVDAVGLLERCIGYERNEMSRFCRGYGR